MFLLFAFGAAIALCALLWRVAVYALPVFIAFSICFWLLPVGGGVVATAAGLIAGVGSWELAKRAIGHGGNRIRFLVIALFSFPAAYMGFEIVWQVSNLGDAAIIWRSLLAGLAGIAAGGTTVTRLYVSTPDASDGHSRLDTLPP